MRIKSTFVVFCFLALSVLGYVLLGGYQGRILSFGEPVQFETYDDAIASLTFDVSRGELYGAIMFFEMHVDEVNSSPRLSSYHAAAVSMLPLFQRSPLDKQSSSAQSAKMFSEIVARFPVEALPDVLEGITLTHSPAFLKLEGKALSRFTKGLEKIQMDSNDGALGEDNIEALVILRGFLPTLQSTLSQRKIDDPKLAVVENETHDLSGQFAPES